MCFHSKATLDDPSDTILGFGLSVKYYPDGKSLKEAKSSLDLLSWHSFHIENVRSGVWEGRFHYFLPLVFNNKHANKALPAMEKTIFDVMRRCDLPGLKHNGSQYHEFHPQMAFQLLAVLMNSMVVELMNSVSSSEVTNLCASEKALEGYCMFHHLMLYFAKRYPCLVDLANNQIESFLFQKESRTKHKTPNLGLLFVSLTLSERKWNSLRNPFVMETFDRNVRWLLKMFPSLGNLDYNRPSDDENRLNLTFIGARTSLRLLMFQVYFMSTIGRPTGTKGPFDVLDRYEKRLGKPTAAQKEDLLKNAKEILAVETWVQFYQRLGGPVPPRYALIQMLKQAVVNSARKRYHESPNNTYFGSYGRNISSYGRRYRRIPYGYNRRSSHHRSDGREYRELPYSRRFSYHRSNNNDHLISPSGRQYRSLAWRRNNNR